MTDSLILPDENGMTQYLLLFYYLGFVCWLLSHDGKENFQGYIKLVWYYSSNNAVTKLLNYKIFYYYHYQLETSTTFVMNMKGKDKFVTVMIYITKIPQ